MSFEWFLAAQFFILLAFFWFLNTTIKFWAVVIAKAMAQIVEKRNLGLVVIKGQNNNAEEHY